MKKKESGTRPAPNTADMRPSWTSCRGKGDPAPPRRPHRGLNPALPARPVDGESLAQAILEVVELKRPQVEAAKAGQGHASGHIALLLNECHLVGEKRERRARFKRRARLRAAIAKKEKSKDIAKWEPAATLRRRRRKTRGGGAANPRRHRQYREKDEIHSPSAASLARPYWASTRQAPRGLAGACGRREPR